MSKATSHCVTPYEFYEVFGFHPCSCHESILTAIKAQYTVRYKTKSYDTELVEIEVECMGCGRSVKKNVSSMGIDGANIGF